jgi:hypothetical protein
LRGRSIILFDTIYSGKIAPNDGIKLNEPGKVPEVYRYAEAEVSQFEQDLWSGFWTLMSTPSARESAGVDVAMLQAVGQDLRPGVVYVVTVQSNGAMLLREREVSKATQAAVERTKSN